jgi:hypothetical protein
MEELLEAIRVATASDATDETKAAGVVACRAVLAALDAQAGAPLAPAPTPTIATPDIAALVAGLKGIPIEQLLDLAIAKLRPMVPTGQAPTVQKLTIPMLPVPRR